ncbi:hypothetical protein AWB80_07854 [Caballeronia pedi]|uniref:Phosphodiester glycosidase domain-containing protein n=1 Tax=Caballeronia pedi TaxID=1777141 RepID=A0A158E0D2_9BURK|nr:phosphodiester glycosidase family protein [Caballeronia pedi]SAL00365.1 hypothetical protein AWB80_07854 [Caballeronia pedi]
MQWARWIAAACCAMFPALACAGGLGLGTLEGTYDIGEGPVPVKGYVAVVEMAADFVPVATGPDKANCDARAPLHRETTLAWQARTRATLAINAGFFYMPPHDVPECQLATYPYKAYGFQASLPPLPGHAPAVLALTRKGAPAIGYADQVDASRFDVIVSGDWIRGNDGAVVHRELLVDEAHVNPTLDLDPRMAVGIRRDTGRLVVVMVEGRRPDSKGLSLKGLAGVMRACGVTDAINLDGGGSATFSYVPAVEPAAIKALKPIPLSQVCDPQALKAGPLALAIKQHSLDAPLRSHAPGGKEVSESGPDKGYRRVLTNLGFSFEEHAARESTEPSP